MATMKWTGQRHRGACSITEAPIERRKFAKPRRNTSQAALDRFRVQEHEAAMKADAETFDAFCADLDAIVLGAKGLTIEALKNIHRRALPLAYKIPDLPLDFSFSTPKFSSNPGEVTRPKQTRMKCLPSLNVSFSCGPSCPASDSGPSTPSLPRKLTRF